MSELVKEVTRLLIRYVMYDDDGDLCSEKWLKAESDDSYAVPRYKYGLSSYRRRAYDWLPRYDDDIHKAIDMAGRLAKIVKVGKTKLARGWEYELVLVQAKTFEDITILADNAMVLLAIAAKD